MKKLVIYAFDQVELLDFCGPYEVFSLAARLAQTPPWEVITVAATRKITSYNGLTFEVDLLLDQIPQADLFLVPGGRGVRQVLTDEDQMAWLADQGRRADILMSVCTGSWLLARAGLVDHLKLTTHHSGLERLRELAPNSEVLANQRYIDNGRVVVSAGISAGIDMALYMVGRQVSLDLARQVADHMEYHFQAEGLNMIELDLVQRPTIAEINLDNLGHNYRQIRKLIGPARLMAIVKANAYGHGLVPVARYLSRLGADMLGVAFIEEGVALRAAGIKTPILVMGGISQDQIPHFLEHQLQITVSSMQKLKQVEEVAAKMGCMAQVHLKFDTGLERIGVRTSNAEPFIREALNSRHCQLEGIFSHLACSDMPENPMTDEQTRRFLEICDHFKTLGQPLPLRHLANSAGILNFPGTFFEMVRPGLLLYGVYPSPLCHRIPDLRPVLSVRSRVVYFKVVKEGRSVSYGATWTADHMVRVITVPIGYGDGYPRSLSNRGEVLLNQKRYPIVGSICMDQFMVNLEWDSAFNGDEVVLLGQQGDASIRIEELAERADTIPYEILTSLNNRVPRVYIENGQLQTAHQAEA